MSSEKKYTLLVKPFFDKTAALILLLLSAPIGVILALLLAVTNKGKVLFFQERIGREEKPFRLVKFRTMLEVGEKGELGTTALGKFLRKLSVDELPQLLNVLKGDMSLVGPRPLLVEYLPYYLEAERARHLVSPGITGWAQVNGRNRSRWDKRMADDCYYVEQISFFLDLRILLLTFIQLFKFNQADFESQEEETFIAYAEKR